MRDWEVVFAKIVGAVGQPGQPEVLQAGLYLESECRGISRF